MPLAFWLNRNKPTLFLSGDRMITDQDRLLEPRQDLPPYDPERFALLDWQGVNLHVESQRAERRPESIQAYMSAHLRETDAFDVLLDDDRAGEAADLVGLRVEGPELIVTLVHCKYSSSDVPGARLSDLYEVCGQVVRSAKWRQHATEPLLRHLDRRAKKYMQRTGVTPFEVGDIQDLYRIRETAPQLRPVFRIIIAQPGLSAAACTHEHLSLFAGAESYVRAVTKGHLQIFCSA